MKRIIVITIVTFFTTLSFAQKVGIKNNLLYDATLTPNIGLEFGLGPKSTLDLNFNLNPFTFKNYKKYKHWMVQPEYRWWFCERFNAGFIGVHVMGGEYSVAKVKLPFGMYKKLRDNRYEGYYYGGGISGGYQWVLCKRWNLEASGGVGYLRFHYDKYTCSNCGPKLGSGNHNYWGITKATISFIYFLW